MDLTVTPAQALFLHQQMTTAKAQIDAFNASVRLLTLGSAVTGELASINLDTGTLTFHVKEVAPVDG